MADDETYVAPEDVDMAEVKAKIEDPDQTLTREELIAINVPPVRPDNDDLDIGPRHEPGNVLYPAQPDLNAPVYILEQQVLDAAADEEK